MEKGDDYSTHAASTALFKNIYNTVKSYDSSKLVNICLEFICPDPFGYATEDEVFLITSEGEHTATRVLGNLESYPIYRVKGTFESGAGNNITITTNGEELQISNVDLKPTETFVVDTSKMTAWIEDEDGNKVQNGLPYIADLNFPTLKVGNNLISVAVTNAEFTKLEIQAKSRWR